MARIALTLAGILAAGGIAIWGLMAGIGLFAGSPTRKTGPAQTPRRARASPRPAFQSRRVQAHVEALAQHIGLRREGDVGERSAGDYIAKALAASGYSHGTQDVPLMYGKTSRNVYASKPGRGSLELILGAHYDTKGSSPGANDNASGVAVTLELARVFAHRDVEPTLVFVFFGAEEMIDPDEDHHHFGSRTFVGRLSRARRARIAGMVSVDMVGYGDEFCLRTMGSGPRALSARLLASAKRQGVDLVYRKDPGEYGWSDHEPFELAGIPAAWIEWRQDPVYHTAGDTPEHIQLDRPRKTGRFLQQFITGMSRGQLEALAASNTNR